MMKINVPGRPFPLEKAEQRFAELALKGFNPVGLNITWEALEHEGPGIYDESYLAYLRKLLLEAEKQGIDVILAPGFTPGVVPCWTLEKIGIDPAKRSDGVQQLSAEGNPGGAGQPTDYAAAVMFTLFFGGNAFAPRTLIDGESAQDWLQTRYIAAMAHCRRRLKNCKALAGWDPMTEPPRGFIGCKDLKGLGLFSPEGAIFKEGFNCPWKQAGVWTETDGGTSACGLDGGFRILKPDYFSLYQGRPVNFAEDFLKPFTEKLLERVNEYKRPVQ
jgi:hypothetical protein